MPSTEDAEQVSATTDAAVVADITGTIGNTDLIRIDSLSELTGCEILLKCEYQNPGGSIKDRAALWMVNDAIASGELKPGMTIVEGTAGNTGIGLALVARALGFKMLTVMPSGQTPEKQRLVELHGAKLHLVEPCPFANPNHFYHTARRLAEADPNAWWANQFENTANMTAHYHGTGSELWQQTAGKLDLLVSVCGTGGTIAGCSSYLKKRKPDVECWLIDPDGSGIVSYLKSGEYLANGSSFTEGIGIMRTVENFRHAQIDCAVNLPDADLFSISRHLRDHDGIVTGSSSALNVAGALFAAAKRGPGKTIVTFACDLGERSYSKLYNRDYLDSQNIPERAEALEQMFERYRHAPDDYFQS